MSRDKEKLSKLLSEGILVTFLTAYLYMLAFSYEYGFLSYFGLPLSFISPNITMLITSTGSIILLLLGCITFSGITLPLFRGAFDYDDENIYYRRFLLAVASTIIVAIVLIRAYGFSFSVLISLILFFLFVLVVNYGIRILNPKMMPLRDRFSSSYLVEDDPFDMWLVIEKIIGRQAFLGVFLAGLFLVLSYISGNSDATKKVDFFVTEIQNEEYILVRKYNDILLFALLDKTNDKILPVYRIENTSSERDIVYKKERVMNLSVEKLD